MKQSGKCPKCGSHEVIAGAKAIDRAHGPTQKDFTVATFRTPEAFIFKGEQKSPVSAWVCGSCGFVELYAQFPDRLKIPAA